MIGEKVLTLQSEILECRNFMKKVYKGLWSLLLSALALFIVISVLDPISLGGHELKVADFSDWIVAVEDLEQNVVVSDTVEEKVVPKFPQPLDTATQSILLIGDSMLEGLSPRLAAYADENGHTLNEVRWYSSTSNVWGECDTLTHYINKFKPTYIFICLGANELFVKDIEKKRDKYVKRIFSQIGDIPYLWIGPPNWKPDTGINRLIKKNAVEGGFFLSDGMKFDRTKDGAHPTRKSSAQWMDSVVRWMPAHSAHPIRMELPSKEKSRPKRIVVLQPKK